MSGSIMGKNFCISTWGESHGKAIGVVVDGCPAGIPLTEEDIQKDLDRRKPGTTAYTTSRTEEDKVSILSGVFEGKTTGTPISLMIQNKDQESKDYSALKDIYRPGHADYTYDEKYGFRDYRGGGRSSGRETAARVAAGTIAKKILSELNIDLFAYTLSIGNVKVDKENFDKSQIPLNPFNMPDKYAAKRAKALVNYTVSKGDSLGGVVECLVVGLPTGVGEPVFEKLDAMISKAIFSIGAVKGLEFGTGFDSAKKTGSTVNDDYKYDQTGNLKKLSNYSGGVVGGISDGSPIVFRCAFKPTPSISKKQHTVNKDKENIEVEITGRHDPVIVPRAVVVVEAMTAITLVDYLFQRILSKIDLIKKALQ